jgi:predicted  nucleic acid-binding Zn-ribbon protein
MEKFKEKINQLKLEIDGSNARADVAEKKLSALSQQLAAKGYHINVIIMIMTF